MPDYPHRAPGPLAPLVDRCLGYDDVSSPDAVHPGLPSRSVTVIVAFDDPLDCGWDDDASRGRFWTLAGGLHTRPVRVHTHGHQLGIQLSLTPLGARALLGVPAAAIHEELVAHENLPLGIPPALLGRLQAAGWEERFRILDAHLLHVAARTDARLHPDLARAWRVITRSGGRVRVEALAAEVGWSRRWLTARFRSEFGIGPKELCRVVRFERARALLDGGTPLATAAHAAGFADQPHLSREFRALAGLPPSSFTGEVPLLQDGPHAHRT